MRYIKKVLNCFNMEKCTSIVTPSNVNSRLLRLLKQELGNVQGEMEGNSYKDYGSKITHVCDSEYKAGLAFAISTVSSLMSSVGPLHWMVV